MRYDIQLLCGIFLVHLIVAPPAWMLDLVWVRWNIGSRLTFDWLCYWLRIIGSGDGVNRPNKATKPWFSTVNWMERLDSGRIKVDLVSFHEAWLAVFTVSNGSHLSPGSFWVIVLIVSPVAEVVDWVGMVKNIRCKTPSKPNPPPHAGGPTTRSTKKIPQGKFSPYLSGEAATGTAKLASRPTRTLPEVKRTVALFYMDSHVDAVV